MLLSGLPVPPDLQARAAGANEIERLLMKNSDDVKEVLENAIKEMNK